MWVQILDEKKSHNRFFLKKKGKRIRNKSNQNRLKNMRSFTLHDSLKITQLSKYYQTNHSDEANEND